MKIKLFASILYVFGKQFCQFVSLTLSLAQFLASIMQWIISQDELNNPFYCHLSATCLHWNLIGT